MNKEEVSSQREAEKKEEKLKEFISSYDSVLIAYSGGVDSTYLLAKTIEVLGPEKVLAVTIFSILNPPGEIEEAVAMAQHLGARHLMIGVDLPSVPEIMANCPERCYVCKKAVFKRILETADNEKITVVFDGSNASDSGDFRPGLKALSELGVVSPLAQAGLAKDEIRLLSQAAKLPTWNKPSAACLASRIPYGEELTVEKLKRVGDAEFYLRKLLNLKGNLRVRAHQSLARIEVEEGAAMTAVMEHKKQIIETLTDLGFTHVTLDLAGFRSGSLNLDLQQ